MNSSRATLLIALSLAAAAFSFSGAAAAADSCKSDADCGTGFFCELFAPPSVGCASKDDEPAECPEPIPTPAAEGFCREKPLSCQSDADCPSYLGCVQVGGDVTCSSPVCEPGEPCPEPVCESAPPSSEKICAPKQIDCTTDAQCPDGFACNIKLGGYCPVIDCAFDSPDCRSECDPSIHKVCGPKEIDCKADADCPADWRCLSFEEDSCSGSGPSTPPSSGSGGGEEGVDPMPAPAPTPGSKTLEDPSCTATVRNLCAPKGYLAGAAQGGSFDNASGTPLAEAGSKDKKAPSYSASRDSNTTPSNSSPGASSDKGCSTSGQHGQGAGLLGVLMVGLAARLARRRSR
jgi:MYXO-CTERM domain-containing protein